MCFRLYGIGNTTTNKLSLDAAVDAVSKILNGSVKPVLVAGPQLRFSKAVEAFEELATASGYATAVMPSAKGHFPETHPNFIGTYWGAVSSMFTSEVVESADKYLFAGPVFNDYRWDITALPRSSYGALLDFNCILMLKRDVPNF